MSWKNLSYTKKGALIGGVIYLIIVLSVLLLSNSFIDEEWRVCASNLQSAQPNIDPGNVDLSSCGEKQEGFRNFLNWIEHNLLKGDLFSFAMLGVFGIILSNAIIIILFIFLGALIGYIFGRIKGK